MDYARPTNCCRSFPKRAIKYLLLYDGRVRDALRRRGECWRMFRPPTAPAQIRRMIADSRAVTAGPPWYYYSPASGTRFLTYQNLRRLGELDDAALRKCLAEVAALASLRNRRGCCEVEFFMADPAPDPAEIEAVSNSSPDELRPRFDALLHEIRPRVAPPYRQDDPDDPVWRKAMFDRLVARSGDPSANFRPPAWTRTSRCGSSGCPAGGSSRGNSSSTQDRQGACRRRQARPAGLVHAGRADPQPRAGVRRPGVREPGGRAPLGHPQRAAGRPAGGLRRADQAAGGAAEVLQIIRMQKWGVRERFEQGRSMEQAMIEAEEYTEYVLDRRLACRQLGMNLPHHQTTRKVSEVYNGPGRLRRPADLDAVLPARCIAGIATDQVPARRLADPAYAAAFARLLGQAAASNLMIGRAELTGQAIFDVGDKIVVEGADGLPAGVVVSDHVGTFVDWEGELEPRAAEYAAPVRRRLASVADARRSPRPTSTGSPTFARVREESVKHSRAFDMLFKYRPWDPAGSLACRWSRVLRRLRDADPGRLSRAIRGCIFVRRPAPDHPATLCTTYTILCSRRRKPPVEWVSRQDLMRFRKMPCAVARAVVTGGDHAGGSVMRGLFSAGVFIRAP